MWHIRIHRYRAIGRTKSMGTIINVMKSKKDLSELK